jgi:hypothetical protein
MGLPDNILDVTNLQLPARRKPNITGYHMSRSIELLKFLGAVANIVMQLTEISVKLAPEKLPYI